MFLANNYPRLKTRKEKKIFNSYKDFRESELIIHNS
jgi:hypothetical protein